MFLDTIIPNKAHPEFIRFKSIISATTPKYAELQYYVLKDSMRLYHRNSGIGGYNYHQYTSR
jgi:hypothetical protein